MELRSGDEITLRRPDNFHLHLRGGFTENVPKEQKDYLALLNVALPHSERWFARGLVMPNTKPAILNGEQAQSYYHRIKLAQQRVNRWQKSFEPLMTIKIEPGTTPDIVFQAKKSGVIAGKLYPDGVTTNSENGVRDFWSLLPTFHAMAKADLVLCIHAESPDEGVDCIDAEEVFLKRILTQLIREVPRLRMVVEHLTTAIGVEFILHAPPNIAATITPHHLEITMNMVRRGTFKPHLHCLPEAKRIADRDKLRWAAFSGNPKFFLGTDSAPHPIDRKIATECCSGIFCEPVAIPFLVSLFEKHDVGPIKLEQFISKFGAEFYELPLNTQTITLIRKPWIVPAQYTNVVPWLAGQILDWQLAEAT